MNPYNCSRRFFIKGVGAFITAPIAGCKIFEDAPLVRFGIVTDCHYTDIPMAHRDYPVGDAYYRESTGKLAECVAVMNRVRRRNRLIFSRHYGFEDGTTWSYGRLAKHCRISEQRVGQIVSSVVDKIKEYARTHA